ncbi:hypothetical protein [Dictyobacter aurantiacus]|uniref:Uncharacterized protein n=1 Tax=Dictyobacter aurantiacus TaxID=1936993 RepID=A0A401ZJK6_9CHLR|nr:hypothetical protein [Dictyobacter aurantiacus]GCE07047.1 hypothetical protein KDAU_43760 [Dictyobacter aurantiacus]
MQNQGNPQQEGFIDDTLHSARQQLENHIGDVIDQYAGRVPGGERFTPEAKQAVSGILDGLQKQLESQAASRMGGLGGTFGGGNSAPTGGNGNSINDPQSGQDGLL